MKKVIFTIFVMVFMLASCVVGVFAYSENSNPGVYVVSPNGGYSLTTPSSTKLSTSAMQQFALDLYTPEFADSFVLWRTDSSHVGTRYVRGVDFVLYNSRYVIRVYDGSSYGYVGYIVGSECRLYWSDLSPYDTDSLLSNISSRFNLLMAENGYLRAFYNSLNSIDSRLENLMASPSGYLANINEKLGNSYSTLVSMNATLDKLMSSPSGYLANINEKLFTLISRLDTVIDQLSVSSPGSDSSSVNLSTIESTLSSINDKLDNLGSSSGSSDNSDVVTAVNGVSDMLEKLFGEYHSTYIFPSIRDREVSISSSSSSGSLMVSGVDAYTLSFIPENYYPNYCVWYIPHSYVSLFTTEFTSSGGLYSGHKATISNPMGDAGGFWYEYKEKFSVSNTSGLPSVVYRNMSFFDLGSTYISLTNVPCSLDYDSSGNVTVSVFLAPVQSSDGTCFFRTNSLKKVPCSGKTLCPTRVRPDNITKEYQWFIYADYSDPVSVYFPAYFNSFLEKQFNRVVDLLGSSGGSSDLTSVTTRLDTIIEQLQTTGSSPSDLSNIENALSTIIDKMDNLPASVDNIVVNITEDNSAYNIFYVEDENGDKKSVTSVAGDSLSASGKLLQFLYKLIIGSAISDVDNSIGGLNDFFFDNAPSGLGEGVTVWD